MLDSMETLVYEGLIFILVFYGIVLVLGPIVLRIPFRYPAKFDLRVIPLEGLPVEAREFMDPRVESLRAWNFEPVTYLELSSVAVGTRAFMALLSNPHTCEWADVSFTVSGAKKAGYIEFITRCSEEMQIDTNTNSTAPVMFPLPQYHLYRFPRVHDVFTLYRVHRMLVNEKTHGALSVLPPVGQEVAELKRRLERYGPWQQERGYMHLDAKGENYRLTWKGAILAAWRGTWPVPLLREWRIQKENQAALNRIGVAT
jgi:hypothetical protein